jgi:enamine deaminase RidA (YjgF/YER057c/UK114 family)
MPDPAAIPLARYSAWTRQGDFIFLSGIIAVDPAQGRIIRSYDDLPEGIADRIGRSGEFSVDAKDGPIIAQSWYVLDKIRATMAEAGGSMADVFKLVQYFRNLSDFPRYNAVRKTFFPDTLPVSTVVEVSAMLPSNEILIEVEATAFVREPHSF